MTEEQNEKVLDVIDYTPYLTSIEERLESIEGDIHDHQDYIHSDIEAIKSEIGTLKTESFFEKEELQQFVKYANTANLLFGVIIMLGLIFGALVFRHFRK